MTTAHAGSASSRQRLGGWSNHSAMPPVASGDVRLSEAVMRRAVRMRDARYDGGFVFAVRTTGVFCRPSCRSRRANAANIEFFARPQQAIQHGYRACKRCDPMREDRREQPALVATLLSMVKAAWPEPVRMRHLIAAGIAPARASRVFRQHFGLSFAAYQRTTRMGAGLAAIRQGVAMHAAQSRAGFVSSSGFRAAMRRLVGDGGTTRSPVLEAAWLASPLGPMIAVIAVRPADESPAVPEAGLVTLDWIDRKGLERELLRVRARFGAGTGEPACIVASEHPLLKQLAAELEAYFANPRAALRVPLWPNVGTPFQQRVWEELRGIPLGETRSYAQQAAGIGRTKAVRAVALANGQNFRSIIIPCHRVIGSDGSLTGYGGGLERKRWLLDHERGAVGQGLFGA